jgi:TolB-like protein
VAGDADVASVASALGVPNLIGGSVRRALNRMRIFLRSTR